jgi:hypothetical protein
MLYTLTAVMRFPRVKALGQGYYHCISGFVYGLFIFGASGVQCLEAEEFLSLMRRREAFSGIQVLDYVLMNNHFHLVSKVPEPKVLTESEMLARIEAGDGSVRAQALREQLAGCAEQPDGIEQSKRLLERYRRKGQSKGASRFFGRLKPDTGNDLACPDGFLGRDRCSSDWFGAKGTGQKVR